MVQGRDPPVSASSTRPDPPLSQSSSHRPSALMRVVSLRIRSGRPSHGSSVTSWWKGVMLTLQKRTSIQRTGSYRCEQSERESDIGLTGRLDGYCSPIIEMGQVLGGLEVGVLVEQLGRLGGQLRGQRNNNDYAIAFTIDREAPDHRHAAWGQADCLAFADLGQGSLFCSDTMGWSWPVRYALLRVKPSRSKSTQYVKIQSCWCILGGTPRTLRSMDTYAC